MTPFLNLIIKTSKLIYLGIKNLPLYEGIFKILHSVIIGTKDFSLKILSEILRVGWNQLVIMKLAYTHR